LKDVGIKSVALFPITSGNKAVGVIFLRFSDKRVKFVRRELVFCQTVANAASIALRNVEIAQMLKAKTLEIEKVQLEAQSKLLHLQRYEEFFMSAADGIVVLERSKNMLFANPEASIMLGMDETELRGRTFTEFLSEEGIKRFERLLEEFSHGTVRRNVDFSILAPDQKERVLSISAANLVHEEEMTLLIMRDVTDERAMAHRLVEAQKKLIESEKRAALVALAGTAAHELNNPLTSVFTSLAMARRQMRSNGQIEERVLDTIENEADRMASIIRQFSKITQYSTTNYVGEARIIDLEKAARPVPPEEES
jgi:PAS domain S-box-containing protein